ncbi:4-alpha-glucanotransferase [Thiomicrospira sp. WB1]|uniref:4-alpha-glucanotransferase n=1 Tax=Thiomicrospira sp. WB1 TaxID=1685380 RepID=UPI00074B0214|nr:4-alpha-glucanotransferase [Thiomicrospira sp. WB1]KUJ71355.1 4-alpha-glucanotransferase [Thiomicrospira sp. WB1]
MNPDAVNEDLIQTDNVREAGVLMHPTSLPSGCLDEQAWWFLDWLAQAGLRVWQVLPLSEPVQGLSPYQSLSAFALNPALLPTDWEAEVDEAAFAHFFAHPPHWLDDYALFRVLRAEHGEAPWSQWPAPLRDRDPEALAQAREAHDRAIMAVKRQQFQLRTLWQRLKADANARGIELFGDVPIFVAYDSADVWANPDQFKLDAQGQPEVVTGVPPDYFSETGQRWGNPHYDWSVMAQDDFLWWRRRMAETGTLFDRVRIDHFRGLEASWEIDAGEDTAINGHWVPAPGKALLTAIRRDVPDLKLVAEDLGIITPDVVALKEAFALPGMSVLQFGFSGLPDNPHALDSQVENSVVYTGTHDNDTSLGWWQSLQDEGHKQWILSLLAADSPLVNTGEPMPWPLIEAALASPARLAMVPLQDFLALDSQSRMNTPGTVERNWLWQFDWHAVNAALAEKIRQRVVAADRLQDTKG